MPDVVNLVRCTSATTGFGSLTLGGAVTGFLTPTQAGMQNAQYYSYAIEADYTTIGDDLVPQSREVGYGQYISSSNVLNRNIINSTNGNAPLNLAGDEQVIITVLAHDIRETLIGPRFYFVRTAPATVTVSVASPTVVTWASHGLSIDDPVVFFMPRDRQAFTVDTTTDTFTTVSGNHNFTAGDPVRVHVTGSIPGVTEATTTYFVRTTGLTTNALTLSTTGAGGTIVDVLALTNTFVNGNTTVTTSSAHGMTVGHKFQFAGTSVVGVSNATDYYVLTVPLTTTFTFSATPGGAAVTPGAVTTQGTCIPTRTIFIARAGTMPTGLTQGTFYYVAAAGYGAGAFGLRTASNGAGTGGSAVNVTAAGTPGLLRAQTGNDNNSGMDQTRSGAFLTIQAGINKSLTIDPQGIYSVTVNVSEGYYVEQVQMGIALFDGNQLTLTGQANPSNCIIAPASQASLFMLNGASIRIASGGFQFHTPGDGYNLRVLDAGTRIRIESNIIYSTSGGTLICMNVGNQGAVQIVADSTVESGIGTNFQYAIPEIDGELDHRSGASLIVTGTPVNVSSGFVGCTWHSFNVWQSVTFDPISTSGRVTGPRFFVDSNSAIVTNGGGANYLPGSTAGNEIPDDEYS